MHPINTIKGAITTGVVLAIIIGACLSLWAGNSVALYPVRVDRWLHILGGITWIGLLYYFNFVQTPALAAAVADKGGPGGAGITKYIAARALLWFRWAAVVTWLSGAFYLMTGYGRNNPGAILNAFTLQPGYRTIGVGAWLGTIMLFNVWVLIWPNQKKILGIVTATDEEKAAARKTAGMASRINVILSIPMIMCMGGQAHGLPF
ncbi:MAG TPA: urate hydroxylase PuuD [Steroidobacteraceae bacterium]|jgi:uncharacterized membrane protein|nr:urate hydroxylase PuuD [Steroidobacteraceae bacterium]